MIKCLKCGAELSDDAKYCSYCGEKIEATLPLPIIEEDPLIEIEQQISEMVEDEPISASMVNVKKVNESKSLADKIKAKGIEFWNKCSLYGKVVTVVLGVSILLTLVAFMTNKTVAIIIAILQIVLIVVSIFMNKGVIKLEVKKSWLKYLVLGVAILFTALNIMSYSWGKGSKFNNDDVTYQRPASDTDANTSDFSIEPIVTTASTPIAAFDCVGQDYSSIRNIFSSAGFTNISVEKVEDLKGSEFNKLNTVKSISVNGNTEFTHGQEFEKTDAVVIRYHAYEKCIVTIHVDFVPNLIFSTYDVEILWNGIEKGTLEHGEDQDFEFAVDPGEYMITFESVESSSVEGEVSLIVDCDIEAAYKISCYSDEVTVESLYVDRLVELAEDEVKLDVTASKYKYENYEDVTTALKTLGFTNIKYNVLYDIVFGWTDEGEVESVSIDGSTDYKRGEVFKQDAQIVITYHMKEEDNPSNISADVTEAPDEAAEITLTMSEVDFKGMNYQEAENIFREMGFTSFEYRTVDTETESAEDTICYIEITEWFIGDSDFAKGDKFDLDSTVTFFSYKYDAPATPSSVFYSTNDFETAMQGNTGVFSYRGRGASYDIYWIIDFDEGYVYNFTDGNGESYCDRLKIESGTLNDRITITYHDGDDIWSYKLYFKYANSPVTLIMVDQNGFDWEYSTTDLDDALALRATKTIKDY